METNKDNKYERYINEIEALKDRCSLLESQFNSVVEILKTLNRTDIMTISREFDTNSTVGFLDEMASEIEIDINELSGIINNESLIDLNEILYFTFKNVQKNDPNIRYTDGKWYYMIYNRMNNKKSWKYEEKHRLFEKKITDHYYFLSKEIYFEHFGNLTKQYIIEMFEEYDYTGSKRRLFRENVIKRFIRDIRTRYFNT
ncbi:hypothetical protein [Heterosigma akashiwo virus 01]|uniref:Uncharacterized protein n=1 Tax=Heterosigma akashiwo virus 01 TaxID=97195 RepID=A0A1C9C5K9_HAV01|nr:hypothetical protein D1R72_gp242 [Heterosigma akashiwo virus 01]AOM63573.1 hypothetical protein [Heterosigma akashiwo virus 01]